MEQDISDNVDPCPFCGSKDVEVNGVLNDKYASSKLADVECGDCGKNYMEPVTT